MSTREQTQNQKSISIGKYNEQIESLLVKISLTILFLAKDAIKTRAFTKQRYYQKIWLKAGLAQDFLLRAQNYQSAEDMCYADEYQRRWVFYREL